MGIIDNKTLENASALLIGVLYIATTAWGYYSAIPNEEYVHLSEWCCVSGVVGGVLYIFSYFHRRLNGKGMHPVVFLDSTLALDLILIATIAMQLNLDGAYWFLHVINPVLVTVHFLLFCDCREIANRKLLLTSIVFPVCYIAFTAVVYAGIGVAPFPASMILIQARVEVSMVLIAGLCGSIVLMAFLLNGMNKWVRNTFEKGGMCEVRPSSSIKE